MPAILLHGGAGNWEEKHLEKAKFFLKEAADYGINLLRKNKTALDVIEKCINRLEDSGLFNAGLGSARQADGKARMDASIMSDDLRCGAVASLEGIKNPISVARSVMEKTNHVLLAGKFARDFAIKNGFEKIEIKQNSKRKEETVGCLVLDNSGNLAGGNSTGGLGGSAKMIPGRIGDSPLIGAGLYVNEFAGAVTTGTGEAFIKTSLARTACFFIENDLHPQKAAEKSIKLMKEKTGFDGGIIILDSKGNKGVFYSTKEMPWVFKS